MIQCFKCSGAIKICNITFLLDCHINLLCDCCLLKTILLATYKSCSLQQFWMSSENAVDITRWSVGFLDSFYIQWNCEQSGKAENELMWGWGWLRPLKARHTLVSSSDTALIASVSSFSWSRHWLNNSWASYRRTREVKYNLSIGGMRGQIKMPLCATFKLWLRQKYCISSHLNFTTSFGYGY